MYDYRVFGLHVRSSLALPELVPSQTGNPDVRVEEGTVDETLAASLEVEASTEQEARRLVRPGRALLYWPEVGTFQVESGRRITIDAHEGVDEALVRLPLLGPVIAALLLQRRQLVLHASAVAIDGHVVGFVGAKGAGKSTMAAALHREGWPLVTDDLLAIRFDEEDTAVADSGIPRFKLWPEAAEAALHDDPETLPPLHARVRKRARTADGTCSLDPHPLKGIYMLSGGDEIEIEPVEASSALFALLPHAYNSPLVEASGSSAMKRWHFQACAQLARHVPVRRLERPADLGRLDEVAARVVADARKHERPAV